jgi:hypothetical protein
MMSWTIGFILVGISAMMEEWESVVDKLDDQGL